MALARWIVCSLALAIGLAAPAAAQVVDLSVSTITFGVAQCFWSAGTPSPEGNVTGKPCDRYFETDASVEWVKGAGTGTDTTGWASAAGLPSVGGAGTFIQSNGSVWGASTPTLPTSATANRVLHATGTNTWGESANLTFNGSTLAVTGAFTASTNITAGGHVIPSLTDTSDIGAADKLFRSAYISTINALVFAETTQTLFGGYSTIGKDAGSFDAAVASGATTVDFGKAMTVGDFILVRAHDSGGTIKAEYMTVGSVVSGTTYNVTRDLAASHGTDPAWTDGTPFLVLGQTGDGRIDLIAVDHKPRMVFNVQGATYNAQNPRAVIGNLNTYFDYATDIYGAGFGSTSTGWLTADPTNGVRIGHGTTTSISLDASGNAYFAGEIEADSGLVGNWTIEEGALTAAGAGLYSDHVVDTALDLNGSSYYASKAFATGTVNNFTLGVWAYASSSSGTPVVMYIGKADNGFGIRIVGGNWGGYYVGAANIGNVSAVALNTWTHLALRRNGGSSQFFVNGVATGAAIGTAPLAAPNGHWSVGTLRNIANSGFEQWFTGRAAHSFYTESVLNDAQIAAIAAGGPGSIGLAPHLVATGNYLGQSPLFQYYPLFGGTPSYDMWNLAPVAPMAVVGGVVAGPSVAMEVARTQVGSGAFTAGLVSAPVSGDVFLYGGTYFGNRAAAPFRVSNTGEIFASSGTIGNWNLSVVGIYKEAGANSAGMVSGDIAFYAGAVAASRSVAPFRVSNAGVLVATNATITGALTATSGNVINALAAGSITSSHIAANTIVAADIFAGTITATELASDSVTSAKILSGTIVASDIATGTITADRMNVSSIDAITANLGTITAGSISGVTVSGSSVYGGAGNEILLNSTGLHFTGAGGNAIIDMNGFIVSYAGSGLYLNGSVSVNGNLVGPVAGSGYTVTYDRISAGTVLEFVNMAINTGTSVVWENACGCLKKVSSSLRYKENIRGFTLDSPYAILDSPLIRFNYKGGDPNVVGLSAEDLFKISPDLVNLDSLGQPDSVRQDAVTAHLIEALREVRRELVDIRGQVKQLSNRP